MNNLLIDERVRKEELDFLKKYFNVIKIKVSNEVYPEISGHSDIFYCKIDGKIICSPNASFIDSSFIKGESKVKYEYPEDILYNVCQIGDLLVLNKFADKSIIENFNKNNGKVIIVNQGYVRCSIASINEKSCITSDIGIYRKLKNENLDVSYLKDDNICLLNKDGSISNMKGFIGGATFTFDNKFVLFGDINFLSTFNRQILLEHLKRNNLELVDFKNLKITDYGSAVIF